MEQVNAWKASDGEFFSSQEECRSHELKIRMSSVIADAAGADFVSRYSQPIFDMMWDVGYRRSR